VASAGRIGLGRDAGFLRDDLLGAQREAGRFFGGQSQRLVHRIGVERLRSAEHRGQRFDRGADQLRSGCWAVRVDPAVWVWKRSIADRSSLAPKRSRMRRA